MLKAAGAGGVPVSCVVRIRPSVGGDAKNAAGAHTNSARGRVVVGEDGQTIRIENDLGGEPFTFDSVYGSTATSSELFATEVAPRVKQSVAGYNAAVVMVCDVM